MNRRASLGWALKGSLIVGLLIALSLDSRSEGPQPVVGVKGFVFDGDGKGLQADLLLLNCDTGESVTGTCRVGGEYLIAMDPLQPPREINIVYVHTGIPRMIKSLSGRKPHEINVVIYSDAQRIKVAVNQKLAAQGLRDELRELDDVLRLGTTATIDTREKLRKLLPQDALRKRVRNLETEFAKIDGIPDDFRRKIKDDLADVTVWSKDPFKIDG